MAKISCTLGGGVRWVSILFWVVEAYIFNLWLCCFGFCIRIEYCYLILLLGIIGGITCKLSVDFTLGDGVTVVLCMGVSVCVVDRSMYFGIVGVASSSNCSILLSCIANVRSIFRTLSPAFKEGSLDDGSYANIFTMYEAACFR